MFVKKADDKNFKEITSSKTPILVKFGATWCAPCKAIAPVLEKFAQENEGVVSVYEIDIDDSPDISQTLKIKGVPTMVLISNNNEVSRKVGMTSKQDLSSWVTLELSK